MSNRCWLFKSEPTAYSFEDLIKDEVAEWDGVRNYQARNMLRDDIKSGDKVLFYHSNAQPLVVVGTALVVKSGYPDHTAWDVHSEHPDPKSTPDNPIWYMVDIVPDKLFSNSVTRVSMMRNPFLTDMILLKKGTRLSIQPVTKEEFEEVVRMSNSIQ
jgi:predicted RNA-binding protein with PUA-like domain